MRWFVVAFLCTVFPLAAQAYQSVALEWDPSPDTSVVGYVLYYGTQPATYPNRIDVGMSTNATVSGLSEGLTYYFAVTAYNAGGVESEPSDELSYTVPSAPGPSPTLTLVLRTNGSGTITPNLMTTSNLVAGLTYTITAAGGKGWMFAGWTGNTNAASPAITFVMRSNLIFQANFAPLILRTNGSGTITPNLLTTPNLAAGQAYTITAAGGPGQLFAGWTGSTNSAATNLTFVMRSNLTFQANFAPLILRTNGNGTISPNLLTTPNLVAGRTYTITAAGGKGQMFAGWTGSTNAAATNLTFVMRSNLTFQANFAPLILRTNGNGTITPNLMMTSNLVAGQTYKITAAGRPGQMFAGWTGSTNSAATNLTFVMRSNLVFQANFAPLVLRTNGSGTITPNLLTMSNLVAGRTYTITAVGGPGWKFNGWTGSTNSAATNLTFVMRSNLTFQANFGVPLVLRINGDGTVSPNLATVSNLVAGRSYTITAIPGSNSLCSNWLASAAGKPASEISTSPKCTFTMQTNLTLTVNFVTNRFLATAGSYHGLFYRTQGVEHASAGFVKVTVTARPRQQPTFTARLQVAGERVRAAGGFNLTGGGISRSPIIFKTSSAALTLRLQLPADGSDTLTGSVSNNNGAWVSPLLADRAVFKTVGNPATAFAGRYTLVIPGTPGVVAGDGYGAVTINNNGAIQVAGSLGDGSRLSQSVPVSKTGDWPLFSPAYSVPAGSTVVSAGEVLGWVSVNSNGLSGTVHWVKTSAAGGTLHPAGFTNQTPILGSCYVAPTATNRVMALAGGNGELILQGGNLAGSLANSLSLSLLNQFEFAPNVRALTLQLSPLTGMLRGSFQHPDNGNTTTPFAGVVLQSANVGRGFFHGTNESGSFRLRAAQ